MALKDILEEKSLSIYDSSMDSRYEALSDRQVVGLCYMLAVKLNNLRNEKVNDKRKLPKEITNTHIDCIGVLKQVALRFPNLGHQMDSGVYREAEKCFKILGDIRTFVCSFNQKDEHRLCRLMLDAAYHQSGTSSLEFAHYVTGRKPSASFKQKCYEQIALPLEGMSCTQAVDEILADPKKYAEKEEAQPSRKRQNQYERYIHSGLSGKELCESKTNAEKLGKTLSKQIQK